MPGHVARGAGGSAHPERLPGSSEQRQDVRRARLGAEAHRESDKEFSGPRLFASNFFLRSELRNLEVLWKCVQQSAQFSLVGRFWRWLRLGRLPYRLERVIEVQLAGLRLRHHVVEISAR